MSTNKELPLQKILNINYCYNYLTFLTKGNKNLIRGTRGHNSCFFKKPIIEGKFYIEVVGYMPEQTGHCYQNGPSFRVGIAPTQYYYNYPLGQDFSVGYKMNGMVIQEGKKITQIEPYTFGDVIGIGIIVTEIHKFRAKDKRVDSNYLQFYKNGKPVGPPLYLMTEDLYTFSASFYNEVEIEFHYSWDSIKYLPEGYRPYSDHLTQKSSYKDSELEAIQSHIMYSIESHL